MCERVRRLGGSDASKDGGVRESRRAGLSTIVLMVDGVTGRERAVDCVAGASEARDEWLGKACPPDLSGGAAMWETVLTRHRIMERTVLTSGHGPDEHVFPQVHERHP